MAPKSKFLDTKITGIALSLGNRNNYQPYFAGISLVKFFFDLDRENFSWREGHFDRLCGSDRIRKYILAGKDLQELKLWLDLEKDRFMKDRKKYLLY